MASKTWEFLTDLIEKYDVDHSVDLVDGADDFKSASGRENPNIRVGTERLQKLRRTYRFEFIKKEISVICIVFNEVDLSTAETGCPSKPSRGILLGLTRPPEHLRS